MRKSRLSCACLSVVAVMFLTTCCQAGLMLTLASSPADLANLIVGDTLVVDVTLSGLTGEELTSLGATVEFDSTLFGVPRNPTLGSLVADPKDVAITLAPGLADDMFFQFESITGITSNGLFFSFAVDVIKPGSGIIRFDPNALFGEVANVGPVFDFGVNELAFSVGVVPEPSGILVCGALFLSVILAPKYRKFWAH